MRRFLHLFDAHKLGAHRAFPSGLQQHLMQGATYTCAQLARVEIVLALGEAHRHGTTRAESRGQQAGNHVPLGANSNRCLRQESGQIRARIQTREELLAAFALVIMTAPRAIREALVHHRCAGER